MKKKKETVGMGMGAGCMVFSYLPHFLLPTKLSLMSPLDLVLKRTYLTPNAIRFRTLSPPPPLLFYVYIKN